MLALTRPLGNYMLWSGAVLFRAGASQEVGKPRRLSQSSFCGRSSRQRTIACGKRPTGLDTTPPLSRPSASPSSQSKPARAARGGAHIRWRTHVTGDVVDEDVERMSREQLIAEVKKLRRGIRVHRDSTGHELCWHHPALWGLLPDQQDPLPAVPDWPEFLRGCVRYRESLEGRLLSAPRSHDARSR
jgi:hypothetical protein